MRHSIQTRSRNAGDAAIPTVRRGPDWNVALAIALGLVLAIGLIGASALLAARNEVALEQVALTEHARSALMDVLNGLESAEAGQRGYLLTHRDDYLQPYDRGTKALPAALDAVNADLDASREAAAFAPLIAKLRAISTDKLAELAETIARARAGDQAGALEVVQTDRGQRDMDALRELIATLSSQQRAVLSGQIDTVNRGGRLLVLADALGFVLLAALAFAIAWGAWQAFKALRAAQAGLAEVNDTLEARVLERTAALTEANEEIQRFAYIVSHDLRAPLVNIMGFTSEMEGAAAVVTDFVLRTARAGPAPGSPAPGSPAPGGLAPGGLAPGPAASADDVILAATEDIPEAVRFIKTSTAKMDRLIGAILKLSREGRRVLSPERVAMRAMAETIAASMQHQAEERGADFVFGAMPDIVTDRLVLEQVFSNLMENALKYLQPDRPGRIEISGRVLGHSAVYDVRDNGRGIAKRDLERVFELFRRAGDQTVPGEGIGLAHVRALVRRLGGRIDCVSALGVGSTFSVELPCTAVMPAAADTAMAEPESVA